MIKFELEGRRAGTKLPGSYKGKRRTWKGRVEKVRLECPRCSWKTRLLPEEKAEAAYARHLVDKHLGAR